MENDNNSFEKIIIGKTTNCTITLYQQDKSTDVIYTGAIPQCRFCQKPTQRSYSGSTTTLATISEIYNEKGERIGTYDPNITTSTYHCYGCNKCFTVNNSRKYVD